MSFLVIYYVQPGDTLYQIAQRYNTTVQRLLELNDLPDPDMLTVGMKLNIDAPFAGGGGEESESGDPYVSRLFDGILHIIATDRLRYLRGEPVRLSLVKVNVTALPITLHYRTGQRFDFAAFREGRELWRWSAAQAFPQVTGRVVLQPGESQSFHVTWDQRDNAGRLIEPGLVTIRGYNAAEELRTRSVPIVIRIRPAVAPAPVPTPVPTPPPGVCPSGNLLADPGFEEWRDENTPVHWNGTNLYRTRYVKSGKFAAGLGAVHTERATLTQSVAGLPGRIYQLRFWAREIPQTPPRGNFTLNATVFFYDAAGRFISRADPVFTQTAIPESYTLYTLTTGLSPAGTARAEVRFAFTPAPDNNNTVGIDDVDFRCI
ncbi:MAG: BsuPI-related putative proteinase inhibitor [Bacillota bacterium]